jgi:murein L,D-transpeptidase YcbB/YkuD
MLFLLSCKKELENLSTNNDLVKDAETNTIIRPIPLEKIEKLDDSIKLYYAKLSNYEIWYDIENRKDLINEIKLCYKDGLDPNDYHLTNIEELESSRDSLNDNEIIEYDILLTKTYRALANHLYKGKVDPKKLYTDWDLYKKEPAFSDSLALAIKNQKVATSFRNLKPQDIMYQKIKHSLVLLNLYPEYHFKKVNFTEKIEPNDTVSLVIEIKKRLKYWKDYYRKDSIISPIYDKYTVEAVKQFQKRHGLKPDGIIGKGTLSALNFSKEERIQQTIANLERWKWFPHKLGEEYLMINLPDYSLNYVAHGDTLTTHTLVVGSKSRKTPILTSKISNLVFNPTWTVPPTIIKEDLTPAASKNLNYFQRNNMTIYNSSGQKILPEEWNPELSKSYRYVQAPSYNNSLGLVKFNFPNRHSVYLHDTNHREYFSREFKALSSGCVRVENPLELTNEILAHEINDWERATIDTLINRKKTKVVPIKHNISVYLFYWTNWSENNRLIFRDDIYNLDLKLYEALRN